MNTYLYSIILVVFFFAAELNGATVSVVNPIQQGGSATTSGPTTMPSTATPSSHSQQKGTGPAVGKLPPQSSGGSSGGARKPKVEVREAVMHPEEPTYTYPGLVAKIGRRWVGNDYLYNLHRNIGVVVEVVQQEGKEVPIDKEGLKILVSEIFERGGLAPEAMASEESPPLPFFHVLIFAFPSDKSNAAFVSGRLFEDALLARYGLDPIGTWQAISWEKQDFVITSPLQFEEQLKKSVTNIAQTFVDRVEMYAKIKEETESNAKLYYPKVIPAPTPAPAPAAAIKP